MTLSARQYSPRSGETVTVQDAARSTRIVSSSLGWVVRVDWTPWRERYKQQARRDRADICMARMILARRSAGKTLPAPWGRMLKYPPKRG